MPLGNLRPIDPDDFSDHDIDELTAEEEAENTTFTPSEVSLLMSHFSPPIEDRSKALDMYVQGTINRYDHMKGVNVDRRASKATQDRTWKRAYEEVAKQLAEVLAAIPEPMAIAFCHKWAQDQANQG